MKYVGKKIKLVGGRRGTKGSSAWTSMLLLERPVILKLQ